jgi:hypothetical protein
MYQENNKEEEEENNQERGAEVLPPNSNDSKQYIDKLTMEYMMNRHHYKKYLAKTDQKKYQETQHKTQLVETYQEDIQEMVSDLLSDFIVRGNFTKYTNEVNLCFEPFMNACLRYFQEHPPRSVNHEDEDVLFSDKCM